MAWHDTKQAAADPDNPAANEQIPFSEWNDMVQEEWNKLIGRLVDAVAIGNDKILVYKSATNSFVFESQSVAPALVDLSDVTISGVPANDEILAYNAATYRWINQTAAEAGIATAADLATYLALAGGTMAGDLNMGTNQIGGVDDMQAYYTYGILCKDSATSVAKIALATTTQAFVAHAEASMNTYRLADVADPTSAQDASTKNYDDTHLLSKEAVASFLDGYIPVYRTASGKFEMEEGGGISAGLPVVDTTAIIKGSADGTKLMRFEVDGITTGTTRVMTVQDKNMIIADKAEVMLLDGTQIMAGDMDIGGNAIHGCNTIKSNNYSTYLYLLGSEDFGASIVLYGENNPTYPGNIQMRVPNLAQNSWLTGLVISGTSDAPVVTIPYGLDVNDKAVKDMKNSAASALSGTQLDVEIDIGGVPYYFTVYPTKA